MGIRPRSCVRSLRIVFGAGCALAPMLAAQLVPPPSPGPPQASPGASQTMRPDQLGSISGKVEDAQSGAPVTSGWVLAHRRGGGAESYGARIQPDGSYKIHRLEPDAYSLRVQADGYAPATYSGRGRAGVGMMQGTPLTVSAGTNVSGIDIKLDKEATIAGRVLDERGAPIARAQITAMQSMVVNNRSQLVPRGFAQTDQRGEYRMTALPPGSYVVAVQPVAASMLGNMIDRSDPVRDVPLPTYERQFYPGVSDQGQATPVAVSAGEEKFGIDFNLAPVGGHTVSGIVVMPDGSPAAGTLLLLRKKQQTGSPMISPMTFTSTNQRDGSFVRTGLSDGVYVAEGGTAMANPPHFVNQEFVVSGEDVKNLRLVLQPGAALKGSLRLEGKVAEAPRNSAPQSMILLRPADYNTIRSFGGMGVASRSQNLAPVDKDGNFRIEDVPPMKYKIRATLAGGYYLSAVYFGAQDVTTEGLDLSQGSGEVSIRVVGKADAGVIEGTAIGENGAAEAGIEIRVFPTGQNATREDWIQQTVSDQTGAFRMETVPPGDYVAIAFPSGSVKPEAIATSFERWKKEGQKITVQPNGRQQVTVKVQKVEEGR